MHTSTDSERSSRRAPLVFVGFFAAIAAALLMLLLVGELVSILVLITILGAAVAVAAFGTRRVGTVTLAVLTAILIASIAVVGVGAAQIAAALFASTAGAADPADPVQLTSAQSKIWESEHDPAFRLELTEGELNAVLQDALSDGDNPFQRVTIDITNDVGDPGRIDFDGVFKSGGLTVSGTLSARVMGGSIDLQIVDVDVGMFTVPGMGRSAIEEMIASVADLESAVAEEGADVQEITIGADKIVITGVNRGERPVDISDVLDAFAVITSDTQIDPEPVAAFSRFPVGRVDGLEAPGSPIYLALGDSLAANLGVEDAALGYVSRFHSQLEGLNETTYGLVNLGVSGETSGTLLNGGQLAMAEAIGAERDVAYVTINIGANDLLGHLGSAACSESIQASECQERIEASLAAYESNIAAIFDRLTEAFPGATILFLTTYNPFSFGFGDAVTFEVASNATVSRLNAIAALTAVEHGMIVADGFTPMQGTVKETTHIDAAFPDVHPTAVGYDVLTAALWNALVGPDELEPE